MQDPSEGYFGAPLEGPEEPSYLLVGLVGGQVFGVTLWLVVVISIVVISIAPPCPLRGQFVAEQHTETASP